MEINQTISSQQISNNEEIINSTISEYLLKSGLFKSVESMNFELKNGSVNIDKYIKIDDNQQLNFGQAYLMELFDLGNKKLFFENWNLLLPYHFRSKDSLCLLMEFYINVYFAVFLLFPQHSKNVKDVSSKIKLELTEFKCYLEHTPSEIAQKAELLPFFALPYVNNARSHPSFKNLITDEWCKDLREKLFIFLTHFLPTLGKPVLLTMMNKNSTLESCSEKKETKFQELEQEIDLLRKKEEVAKNTLIESQNKWTNFCKGVMKVSKDIIFIFQKVAKSAEDDSTLKDLIQKLSSYEEFIYSNEKDFHNLIESYKNNQSKGNLPMPELIDEEFHPYDDLNFIKMKDYIKEQENALKICSILQALRWIITRSRHGQPRKHVLNSYINNDLFDCDSKNNLILKNLLFNENRKVIEYSVCLINVIASDTSGVKYFSKSKELISWIIDILYREKDDTNLRQNALGILQKFSLHRKLQLEMINKDIIKWILTLLRNNSHCLSEYTLEYSSALLMNLSLRSAGKNKCEDPSLDIVRVLSQFLDHENIQMRTYINGTLYSILSRRYFKEKAYEIGLHELISSLLSTERGQLNKQLLYLIEQLKSNETEDYSSSENEEFMQYDENDDYQTEDEEEADPEILNANCKIGEELLLGEFAQNTDISKGSIFSSINTNKIKKNTNDQNTMSPNHVVKKIPFEKKGHPKVPKSPINQNYENKFKSENNKVNSFQNCTLMDESKFQCLPKIEMIDNNLKSKEKEAIISNMKNENKKLEANNNNKIESNNVQININNIQGSSKSFNNQINLKNPLTNDKNDNSVLTNQVKKSKELLEIKNINNSFSQLSETQELNLAFATRSKIQRTPICPSDLKVQHQRENSRILRSQKNVVDKKNINKSKEKDNFRRKK